MSEFLKTILEQKCEEIRTLSEEKILPLRKTKSFYQTVIDNPEKIHVIAELKKASPSLGEINTEVDILKQAKTYESAGASMVSVLTDQFFFKGHIDDLRKISQAITLPTLAKDFIISKKQIIRARNAGATVILLIVAALSFEDLKDLYNYAESLGLEVLVETHDLDELKIAHEIDAKIIGVNNRNLKTFETSLEVSLSLRNEFKRGPIYISESAIFTADDVRTIAPYFQGILVGTALMKSDNVQSTLRELQVGKS